MSEMPRIHRGALPFLWDPLSAKLSGQNSSTFFEGVHSLHSFEKSPKFEFSNAFSLFSWTTSLEFETANLFPDPDFRWLIDDLGTLSWRPRICEGTLIDERFMLCTIVGDPGKYSLRTGLTEKNSSLFFSSSRWRISFSHYQSTRE